MNELAEQINIKHKCAMYAYECITEDIIKTESQIQEKYLSEIRSTATRIHDSGLLQTLAFYCSKKEDEHFKKLSLHIMKWILQDETINGANINIRKWDENQQIVLDFMALLLNKNDEEIMLKTGEAMEVSQWLSRFAVARLKE